jgi:hypothetical protein
MREMGKKKSKGGSEGARHVANIEPKTEVPPAGMLPGLKRAKPYVYSDAEIDALLTAALALPPEDGLRRWRRQHHRCTRDADYEDQKKRHHRVGGGDGPIPPHGANHESNRVASLRRSGSG